jgi:hypothetical protein
MQPCRLLYIRLDRQHPCLVQLLVQRRRLDLAPLVCAAYAGQRPVTSITPCSHLLSGM